MDGARSTIVVVAVVAASSLRNRIAFTVDAGTGRDQVAIARSADGSGRRRLTDTHAADYELSSWQRG